MNCPLFQVLLLCSVLVAGMASVQTANAQREMGIPFEKQAAYVLAFSSPHETIRLDLGANEWSTDLFIDARVAEQTSFLDDRGKKTAPSAILPGMEVLVKGEKLRSGFVIKSIRLKTRISDWRVKLNGLYEKFDGQIHHRNREP